MESDDRLQAFLNKVLAAPNSQELGQEVLGVLQQWRDEASQNPPATPEEQPPN